MFNPALNLQTLMWMRRVAAATIPSGDAIVTEAGDPVVTESISDPVVTE